jgi:predicted PurR-regulated permease PerM
MWQCAGNLHGAMQMKYIKPIFAAAITGIILAFVFWLGGYDFDRRGSDVAWSAGFTLFFMFFVFALVSAFQELSELSDAIKARSIANER